MLTIWCLQITKRLEVGTNCSSVYNIFLAITHIRMTHKNGHWIHSAANGFFITHKAYQWFGSVNNQKLVKPTRTISVTLHFLPLVSQQTAGAIVCRLSSVQETTNNKLQHDHDRDNQNSVRYIFSTHACTAEFWLCLHAGVWATDTGPSIMTMV